MPRKMDLTGHTYGLLSVVAEAPTRGVKTEWVCRCQCGETVTVRSNNLRTGNTKSCGCFEREGRHVMSGSLAPRWQKEVKYAAAHIRVGREKGPAREHSCVDCGETACDWSYEGGDPDERIEIINDYPRKFSLDPDRYRPRCRPCHRKKDIRETREQRAS